MFKTEYVSEINDYIQTVKLANNEEAKKQRFISLLNRLFGKDQSAREIIDRFTVGAEKSILNIPRMAGKSGRGRADTQYVNIIIEFEKDLKKTGKHAEEQLVEYLLGNWKSGVESNFILIATDCTEWRVYAPDLDSIAQLNRKDVSGISLISRNRLDVSEATAEEFYYFLDTYLFKSEKEQATLRNIQHDFGQTSNTFVTAFSQLDGYFQSVKNQGEVKVAFEQWKKFLSIAYDTFDASENIFLIHTYLSVFAKMLAYEVITHDDHIDDDEIKGIISGAIFDKKNIKNFTDNDFFHWVGSNDAIKSLRGMFRAISSQIDCYDFNHVEEDVLKGVYQELIDRDTRQSLGEYYTPDWLCESIVNDLDMKADSKILDPSCGSGSFLRIAIDRLKKEYPSLSADKLAQNVCGIDIHPLSVLIAKTTVLVALGDTIKSAKQPISLNVFLADTLLLPSGSAKFDMLGDQFEIWIDDKRYGMNTSIFTQMEKFDTAINIADDLADYSLGKDTLNARAFEETFKKRAQTAISAYDIQSYHSIYKGLKEAKENGRDSIWKFIILNLYKPCFFHHMFDFVIGNPPWFTYGNIQNSAYQDRLKAMAHSYNVKPDEVANFPHLEIAAIFLAHCTSYFLKDKGKLAFVLPRSFLSGAQHEKTRSGKARDIRITDIWDLDQVSPLFNVPSCVFFTERAEADINKKIPASGREGRVFEGNFPRSNVKLAEAQRRLTVTKKKFYYSTLGKASAFTTSKSAGSGGTNFYKKHFRQGATLVPRNFYFVDITQETDGDLTDRILTVKTSAAINKEAKVPWKGQLIEGRIHTDFLFRTALAQNILPFVLYKPELVLLPIALDKEKTIKILSPDQILQRGHIDTAKWFQKVEKLWEKDKTEKSKKMRGTDRLNYQRLLSSQHLRKPYLVIYTASAKDANATVVKRSEIDMEFIVESKAYVFFTSDLQEAYYLAAFLNADAPNKMIKAFQTRGLFGPRDVHKRILDVPLPAFDKKNATHMKLSRLGESCSEESRKYVESLSLDGKLGAYPLGKVRSSIKEHLKKQLKDIDQTIKAIVEKVE